MKLTLFYQREVFYSILRILLNVGGSGQFTTEGLKYTASEAPSMMGIIIKFSPIGVFALICPVVATVFIAQVFGVDLSISQMLTIVVTATLASIGTAGVPGAGMIMLAMVLQSVGLPIEGIALVAGDAACSFCIETLEEKKENRKSMKAASV